MEKVRAKFICHSITEFISTKEVKLGAIYSDSGENKDFTNATPSGSLSIMINKNYPASIFFEPGKEYYLDFIAVKNE